MSLRSIVFSLLVLPVAAGCGGGGGRSFNFDDGPAVEGAFKISYFRAYPAARTKKPEPTFRVVMSETWKDRIGDNPRNPLIQAAPGKIFKGFMFDRDILRLYKQLKGFGLHKLKYRDPKEWDFREMNRLARDPTQTSFTRVITVGTDAWARSYYYRDQQFSTDSIEAFVKCESFVSRIVDSNSTWVGTQSSPLFRRTR